MSFKSTKLWQCKVFISIQSPDNGLTFIKGGGRAGANRGRVNIFCAGQKGGSSKFGHVFGGGSHIFLLQSISIAEM